MSAKYIIQMTGLAQYSSGTLEEFAIYVRVYWYIGTMEHSNVSQTSTLSSAMRGSMVVVVTLGVGGLACDSGFVHFQHYSFFSNGSTLLAVD